ncbi:MAG: Polyphosphate:nucleotide phosphotransferase, PPK2 family [uncultured Thiotrichaceae bacterium]|uniref:Polyphosphate:nucleotide phosphotransferase, PPK2 family n=1 Tax=uncultured Thiotrichaceae bacterium TaxID=298394 RepID=A0A6S6SHR5_9GAMM|nr:MAG: Polyphosphate:nucleotide phosphotransferase, PPK2 family [uncultured Thiotrichaceae bacterium]
MINFPKQHRVAFDGSFDLGQASSQSPSDTDNKQLKKRLKKLTKRIDELQRILYAHDHHSVLLVFQAMDAAGKDSTIRSVMSGVNPAGCQVYSFKQPSAEEKDHDFLWRTAKSLPERGRIGIYNRSYYEEVLVVRVHPEYLEGQNLPVEVDRDTLWQDRFESIRDHEKHLARNGTLVLKFWLNVSKAEQKRRFLARLDEPEKNWKFSTGDVAERQHWDEYMNAYSEVLGATSREYAPWYAIPADSKPYMRVAVAEIIVEALEALSLEYPEVSEQDLTRFQAARRLLEDE